jgi:hypothetical protein
MINSPLMSETALRIKETAEAWLCDSYLMDTRFIAQRNINGQFQILSAALFLSPLPSDVDNSFEQTSGGLYIGQSVVVNVSKKDLAKAIQNVIDGVIHVYGNELLLSKAEPLDYYSESLRRDIWFYALHLTVTGDRHSPPAYVDSFNLDNALRNAKVPFDGVADLAAWLGVNDPTSGQDRPSITFRMNPSADLLIAESGLSNGRLSIQINAHPKLAKAKIGIAVRSVPGNGLSARTQIASSLRWARPKDGIQIGKAFTDMEAADQALVVLSVNGIVVRRHWFIDPARARNLRLVAVQQFDSDLRMIRRELLKPSTPDKFELSVAALLFLLGFNPAVQIETDSPDIVVMTPEGRLALVECTTRIADNMLKIGKLVDRRVALMKSLGANGHPIQVMSVLVCALSKEQLTVSEEEIARNKIVLFCNEDIVTALDRLRFPSNPDQMFVDAESRFINSQKFLA